MKIISLFFFLVFTNHKKNAQVNVDDINGTWQPAAKDAKLIVYREGKYYMGKIIWLKNPGKDTENPKAELRSRGLVGTVILRNFIFNGKDKWLDGKIYDPSSGKTYSCNIRLRNNNTLEIRGYIGISLLGKTEVWTRSL